MITARRLREVLHYDPVTGVFTWLKRKEATDAIRGWNTRRVGNAAGYCGFQSYWYIGIDGKNYRAHRLAFLYMKGRWPMPEADHKDMDRSNNRWLNIREATKSQNALNRRMKPNNSSGLKGVCWDKQTRKWRAQLRVNGVYINIGRFDTKEEAHAAYCEAAAKYCGEFARAA